MDVARDDNTLAVVYCSGDAISLRRQSGRRENAKEDD
jgi:hypothetical protein